MSASSVTLKYLLLGDSKSAEDAMKRVSEHAKRTGHGLGGMAVVGAAALGAVAVAAIALGKSAVDKFKEVGSETLGLRRIMGGTAEEASRLRFAAEESGVSYETLAKSTGKFEKALSAATGTGKSNTAMIKLLGTNYRDAHGKILPMSVLIPKLSDKFKAMPGGAEKTALAMKLFGKAGADMLPFLNKGSTAINALTKESDKYGLTLSGKNVAALIAAKQHQREWNATLDGLKVQIGIFLMPILQGLVQLIRDKVIPVVLNITHWFQQHKDGIAQVAQTISHVFQGVMKNVLIPLLQRGIAVVREIIKWVRDHKEGLTQLGHVISVVVVTAIKVFITILKTVGTVLQGLWSGVIRPVASAIATAFRGIGDGISWALANVIRPAIKGITSAVKGIRTFLAPIITAISNLWTGIGDGLQWAWDNIIQPIINVIMGAIHAVQSALASFSGAPSGNTSKPGAKHDAKLGRPIRRASGGPVLAGMPYIVGDGGRPELFIPNQSGRIQPSVGTGGTTVINYNVTISGITDKRGAALEIQQALLGLKRTTRGQLGLA